jgi:hypothetical protein
MTSSSSHGSGGRRGKPRRGRPPSSDTERKDRLIQTRVEEDLDETLRAAAKQQRVTVSQLIRNVLHDTFKMIDDVVVNTTNLTESVKRDARRIAASAQGFASETEAVAAKAAKLVARTAAPTTPVASATPALAAPAPTAVTAETLDAALAWQEVVMGRERPCARCGNPLAKGDQGFLGVLEDPTAPRPFICPGCAAALGQAPR